MKARDAQVVSLGEQLGVEGYRETPFAADSVRQFLNETTKIICDRKERAEQEKVRRQSRCIDISHIFNERLILCAASFLSER